MQLESNIENEGCCDLSEMIQTTFIMLIMDINLICIYAQKKRIRKGSELCFNHSYNSKSRDVNYRSLFSKWWMTIGWHVNLLPSGMDSILLISLIANCKAIMLALEY